MKGLYLQKRRTDGLYMQHAIKYALRFLLCLAYFVSCGKNAADVPVKRTIIVYMAADNDLSGDADADIEEMKKGFSEKGTNLIVFIDPVGATPYILKIKPNGGQVIKNYPEFNSADASQMRQVLNDIIGMYPAESYGLILWSHGTSWLPAGSKLKSFGDDNGKQTDIPALVDVLPVHFDYILFDACLMGAVEVAYELKDKADYIIASSTETIYEGFPYDQIIPELISSDPDLKKVAERYFKFYDDLSGAYRSATVSLIDTRQLDDLAALVQILISENAFGLGSFERTRVQRLDVYGEQYIFDFFDFINHAFPDVDKQALMEQLNKTVLYKAHTPMFIEQYEINTYCGLSCYIPHLQRDDLNAYYQQLGWCAASGFTKLFK